MAEIFTSPSILPPPVLREEEKQENKPLVVDEAENWEQEIARLKFYHFLHHCFRSPTLG